MSFRILHTADWHLGKFLYERDLLEDQQFFLDRLLDHLKEESKKAPYDAVIVSGDIYDTVNPSGQAMEMLDRFYVRFVKENPETHLFLIKGNHDSMRVGHNKIFLEAAKVHLRAASDEIKKPVILEKDDEKLAVFQLPFLNHTNAIEFEKDSGHLHTQTEMIEEACRQIKEAWKSEYSDSMALLSAHLTTFGSIKSAYDDNSIGTIDEVDSGLFEDFDYTALGHIHKLQKCGSTGKVWYSGAPLPYYFDSSNDTYFLDVTLKNGQAPQIKKIEINPLHKIERLEGKIADYLLSTREFIEEHKNNYLEFIYTDEVLEPNAIPKLKKLFPLALSFRPKGSDYTQNTDIQAIENRQQTFNDPEKYFDAFFKDNYGQEIPEDSKELHEKAKALFIKIAREVENPPTEDDFVLTGED